MNFSEIFPWVVVFIILAIQWRTNKHWQSAIESKNKHIAVLEAQIQSLKDRGIHVR